MTNRNKRASYHHDDLRKALVHAAVEHLRQGDITTLSMNRLAKVVGVSAGAPYHHFADKTALLAAVGEEGFGVLVAALRPALELADPVEALARLAEAYLVTARTHVTHYRVMFLAEYAEDRSRFPALHRLGEEALTVLTQVLARGLSAPNVEEVALERGLLVFAALHGFASLEAADVLATVPQAPSMERQRALLVERIVRLAFDAPEPATHSRLRP